MMTVKDFAEQLKKEKSVALFCHVRPDGDTIGSALGIKFALNKLGIKADVYCEEEIPEKFFYLEGAKEIRLDITERYSSYMAVDCADVTRVGKFCELFQTEKNNYNFDHHISNNHYAKYNVIIDTSATAENATELVLALVGEIPEESVNALATGLVTDTGNFKHKNVTENTFKVASILKANGADFNKITYYNFTKQSKNRANLFGEVMSKIRYLLDDRLAVITVYKSQLSRLGAKPEETEGFVDFVMGIDSVEVGVCIMEMDNGYKASFRSKEANVNEVAGKFGGGGHVLASGCRYNGNLEEFIDKIRYYVSQQIRD